MIDVLNTVFIYPLELLFEIIFILAYRIFNDSALSVITLSLTVNLLVLPLYNRADVMQKQQRDAESALKDGVARIRNAFKGDERMMILQAYYRENGYSPLFVLRMPFPCFFRYRSS